MDSLGESPIPILRVASAAPISSLALGSRYKNNLPSRNLRKIIDTTDLRLLCGSAMPYELVYMQKALTRCKGMTVQTLGIYVPLDIRELVQYAIGDDMLFADPSHELFDGSANGDLNKRLVKKYPKFPTKLYLHGLLYSKSFIDRFLLLG